MNKLAGLNALREISREEFLELAKNGARELFDLAHYKIFDGSDGNAQSHFVYDMGSHRCYLINKDTCYDLVTAFYCGGSKEDILENLNKVASSVQ